MVNGHRVLKGRQLMTLDAQQILRESGHWAYVSFATKTRGWVPVELIEPIIPEGVPKPPRIRKPKADGKSA